jgi:hypothetical protein
VPPRRPRLLRHTTPVPLVYQSPDSGPFNRTRCGGASYGPAMAAQHGDRRSRCCRRRARSMFQRSPRSVYTAGISTGRIAWTPTHTRSAIALTNRSGAPPRTSHRVTSKCTPRAAKRRPAMTDQRPVPAKDGGRLHQEQITGRQLAAEGARIRRSAGRQRGRRAVRRRTSNSWRRARSSRSRSAVGRPRRMRKSISRRRRA